MCTKGKSSDQIRKEVQLVDQVQAPVVKNDKIGEIVYYYGKEKIGSVDILASDTVNKAKYKDYFMKLLNKYFMGS